ncbi:PmoA family protein [Luteolibacter flavescens]|uniref:PmoA family protein n=1 Tax=Luteolibacter flavescens TaxID=1859460 RepID=A0ABT3FV79_9BACT|nr:PmoA family protein [Luteolibacter flavescens]MCW1887503.1 PmoA family protein [Luteolibacter flavescens]
MKRLILPLLFTAAASADEGFTIKATTEPTTVQVELDGKPFTAFHTDSKVPYLYPLLSESGATLSRRWPMDDSAKGEERDHPHHRSFWMSHGEVNGHDFWAFQFGKDPRIETKKVHGMKNDSFTVDLAWTAGGKTHLTEERTYSFKKLDDKTTLIGVSSKLTAADGDAKFGDTKEGFFALRVDRTLRQKGAQAKGHIADSEGRKDNDCWGKRSKWVAFTGPDEKDEPAVLAIFDHPSNLRFPTWWHARDYGLLAANPFGIHDFEKKDDKHLGDHVLKKGESMTFRYGVVLHHGSLESARLADHWTDFSQTP